MWKSSNSVLYAIRAGETLTFEPFSINRQGISSKSESLIWPQVQEVNVSNGRVSVKKAGKSSTWGAVQVAKIPNFLVFMTVAEEMVCQSRSR